MNVGPTMNPSIEITVYIYILLNEKEISGMIAERGFPDRS
jgi:hypothetical protein